jgi:hypothetical protein
MYGAPGAVPAPGVGSYEFNETENKTVNTLASRLMIAGIMSIAFGVISFFGSFLWDVRSGILGAPGSIATGVIGIVFLLASGSFKQITRTQGNDMGHLMEALRKMTLAATVQIIGYIAAAALFLLGIVVIVFLWAAIIALFAIR